MATEITNDIMRRFRERLERHPVYDAVASIADLRCFMRHHVYPVWDFMSLLKYLQLAVARARCPWIPEGNPGVRRFINELVLEEETDQTLTPGEYASHFELYQRAMAEIGAATGASERFIATVRAQGVDAALALPDIPEPARVFTTRTFSFIDADRPHEVAAALALGREHIIPCMFRSILARMGVSRDQAPTFHFYLERHIHLDEGQHAPLSLRLLNSLCADDPIKVGQALTAADTAIEARLTFWDGVLEAIRENRAAD